MIFQDNIIKEFLKNVYFITGTPCGGKTTISRELAKRHNLLVYDIDERFDDHRRLTDALHQPAMNRCFQNADEFFGRSVEEYRKWLIDNTREQIVFLIKEPSKLIEDYCNRKDHQDFNAYINSTSDVAQAKKTCNETLRRLNEEKYTMIKNSHYFWLERDQNSTVEETVQKVEHYLGLDIG